MILIKSMLQKNLEFSQLNPEKDEAVIAVIHAYSLVRAIQKKKNVSNIDKIYKACLKIPKEQRAWKIQKFVSIMQNEIDIYITGLKIEDTGMSSEYDTIDFTEYFDTVGTEIIDVG